MHSLLNPEILISTLGYAGIFVTIFLESGFFFGFFLPGDTLLFTVGFLASGGVLHFGFSLVGIILATFLGSIVGYFFGKKVGPKIFFKKNSLLFDPKNLEKTRVFYRKYGKWTATLCRFVPFVRTFAPILAGVGEMSLKDFLKYNILGAIMWPVVGTAVGYFFGSQLPSIHKYVMPAIALVFLSSFIPLIITAFRKRK
jgi:membrane-associated protein